MEELQQEQSLFSRFKSFIMECRRVLIITKKPTRIEFKTIVKASALGMIIIGLIGFIIQIIRVIFFT